MQQLLLVLVLLVGGGLGFFAQSVISPKTGKVDSSPEQKFGSETEVDDSADLEAANKLALLESQKASILKLIEQAKANLQINNDPAEEIPVVKADLSKVAIKSRELAISSIAEAEDVLVDAMAVEDVRTLWQLLFYLLRQGEPGYEKILELGPAFEEDMRKNQQYWMRSEELVMGPFFKDLTDHGEELFAFIMYLDGVDDSRLTRTTKRLKSRFFEDEVAGVLMGFIQLENSELVDDIADQVAERLVKASSYKKNRLYNVLAQLPGAERTRMLAEYIDPLELKEANFLLHALQVKGDPAALPILREHMGSKDPSFSANLERTIRILESRE